jgi:hypothetical protein
MAPAASRTFGGTESAETRFRVHEHYFARSGAGRAAAGMTSPAMVLARASRLARIAAIGLLKLLVGKA